MEKKNLYPLRFIPHAVEKDWGGNALTSLLGKKFPDTDEDGNPVTKNGKTGESWEIADMGFVDSMIENGWLAGNTIGDVMETYIERISGDNVYQRYGRQFPILVKFLDIQGKTSVQINPDDEAAEQRYDALGKSKMWYIMEASENAKIHLGFRHDITARELYDRCLDGTIHEDLNEIRPHKGDAFLIPPGTVHYAEGGLLIAEIQESSDLTFRLFDWGRENDPMKARPMHLEEAFDLIDLKKCDIQAYYRPCGEQEKTDGKEKRVHETLFSVPQFTVCKLNLKDPVMIHTAEAETFSIYVCIEGEASIQVPEQGKETGNTEEYRLKKGETILIPADMPDFSIVPTERDTVLLETFIGKYEEPDNYINPDTEPYLEDEDYDGVQDLS